MSTSNEAQKSATSTSTIEPKAHQSILMKHNNTRKPATQYSPTTAAGDTSLQLYPHDMGRTIICDISGTISGNAATITLPRLIESQGARFKIQVVVADASNHLDISKHADDATNCIRVIKKDLIGTGGSSAADVNLTTALASSITGNAAATNLATYEIENIGNLWLVVATVQSSAGT